MVPLHGTYGQMQIHLPFKAKAEAVEIPLDDLISVGKESNKTHRKQPPDAPSSVDSTLT